MPCKICGTYTLANGDKLFISGLTEPNHNTDIYNRPVCAGQVSWIDNVELVKSNGLKVDVTELVIELEIEDFLLGKCA